MRITMKRRKSKPQIVKQYPVFPVGTIVEIVRPHLWSGCTGEVVAASSDGIHRIKIAGKDGQTFQSEANGDEIVELI